MPMKKTTTKPKYEYGEGKWERLEDPDELRALVASCDSASAIAYAAGLGFGGMTSRKLKGLAEAAGVTLPRGRPGPKGQALPVIDASSEDGDKFTSEEQAAAKAAIEDVRHRERLADSEGRTVQVLRKTVKDLYGIIEKHQTQQEMVFDAIERTVVARKPVAVKFPRTKGGNTDEHLLMPDISDVHLGELIRREQTGGLGGYDWPTFQRRYEAYKEGFAVILNDILRKGMPIRNGVCMVHGDLGTNENIYPGQPFHIDMLAFDQLYCGADYLAALFQFMASQLEHLEIHFVPGNHGRFQNSTLNLDVMMHKIISQALAAQPNITIYNSLTHFAAWRIGPDTGHVKYPDGCDEVHDFFLIHGDAVKQYLDQPAYGMCRSVQRYAQMCGVPFKYGHYAHYHQLGRFGNGHVYSNGAWSGGSEYSVKGFQSAAEPAQSMFVLHGKYGIVMDYPIRFGEPSARLRLKDEDHVYTPYDSGDATHEPAPIPWSDGQLEEEAA